MGLLDDAIREHLDLKRARGGDPAEIERMEREALGPVRRDPTIGSTRFEAADGHSSVAYEPRHPDDHVADLEDLRDLGYHDSTAPHPHHHDDAHLAHEHADAFAEEPEQPRRRFLRRNRPAPQADAGMQDSGFHELQPAAEAPDPFDYDPLEHHGLVEGHEMLDPLEPLEHHEPLDDHEARESEPGTPSDGLEPPPPVQFDKPPKRPRFAAEPASSEPATSELRADEAPEEEPQETTEFDVERHIAETRHLPDEDVAPAKPPGAGTPADAYAPAEAGAPTDADAAADAGATGDAVAPADADEPAEDVLEETPDFLQDTPEHDRLWFEQRPPKDFDFDG